jgi:hypothetical protein
MWRVEKIGRTIGKKRPVELVGHQDQDIGTRHFDFPA